jgi:hypothetical protein
MTIPDSSKTTVVAANPPGEGNKCVLVIDEALPLGVITNTAAVLSLTLGKEIPSLIGRDLLDSSGATHRGITTVALPILKGTQSSLRSLREAVRPLEPALIVVDLIDATRTTKSYDAYAQELAKTPAEQLNYLGVALYGAAKAVNRFTGSLGLLR